MTDSSQVGEYQRFLTITLKDMQQSKQERTYGNNFVQKYSEKSVKLSKKKEEGEMIECEKTTSDLQKDSEKTVISNNGPSKFLLEKGQRIICPKRNAGTTDVALQPYIPKASLTQVHEKKVRDIF